MSRKSEFKLSAHLQSSYADYYAEGPSEWRWLGAVTKADNIRSLCGHLPIQSVIEIGAGEGAILQRLSDVGFAEKLYALEISPTGVQAIRDREIPGLEECSLFDGYTVPYDDQAFDLAVLSHVLEHVEYPRRLVYEAKRIARFVFVEVPLEDTWRLARDFVRDEVGHINPYSPKTIRRLLQTCDLEILDQVIVNRSRASYTYQTGKKGLVSYYIKDCLLRVLPFLATKAFTYHAAFVCQDVRASS